MYYLSLFGIGEQQDINRWMFFAQILLPLEIQFFWSKFTIQQLWSHDICLGKEYIILGMRSLFRWNVKDWNEYD